MNGDGASNPADLMLLPAVFLVTLAAGGTLLWLARRAAAALRRRPDAAAGPVPEVPEALGHLRAAGLDPDDLIGPWLSAQRPPADHHDPVSESSRG